MFKKGDIAYELHPPGNGISFGRRLILGPTQGCKTKYDVVPCNKKGEGQDNLKYSQYGTKLFTLEELKKELISIEERRHKEALKNIYSIIE